MIKDETINHHWSHCAYVFFISGLCSRLVKVAVNCGVLVWQAGLIFACACILVAAGYWLFWFLSELNEIIPRENHRNLFLRSRFSWRVMLEKTNFFELAYRLSVLAAILIGSLLSAIS